MKRKPQPAESTPNEALSNALASMSDEQRARFFELAETTPESIRQLTSGRRRASAEMAIRLDDAAAAVGVRLPREKLSAACASCIYAAICEGVKNA